MCIEMHSACKRWWKGRNEDFVVKSLRESRNWCGCTSCLSLYPAATPCSMFKFRIKLCIFFVWASFYFQVSQYRTSKFNAIPLLRLDLTFFILSFGTYMVVTMYFTTNSYNRSITNYNRNLFQFPNRMYLFKYFSTSLLLPYQFQKPAQPKSLGFWLWSEQCNFCSTDFREKRNCKGPKNKNANRVVKSEIIEVPSGDGVIRRGGEK